MRIIFRVADELLSSSAGFCYVRLGAKCLLIGYMLSAGGMCTDCCS